MYTHELRDIISRDIHLNRQFLDIFAANELPYQIPVGSWAIVNCCNRGRRRQHWIAICQETSNRLEMFDSYGSDPFMYNLENKLPVSNVVVYNTKQLQSIFQTSVDSTVYIIVISSHVDMLWVILYRYFQRMLTVTIIMYIIQY